MPLTLYKILMMLAQSCLNMIEDTGGGVMLPESIMMAVNEVKKSTHSHERYDRTE